MAHDGPIHVHALRRTVGGGGGGAMPFPGPARCEPAGPGRPRYARPRVIGGSIPPAEALPDVTPPRERSRDLRAGLREVLIAHPEKELVIVRQRKPYGAQAVWLLAHYR